MNFTNEQKKEIEVLAKAANLPFAGLLAIVSVESNGISGEVIGGKLEPIIRYEGHYFDKLCPPAIRDEARKAGVSSPEAGGIKNPKKQADRWALVRKAATYDRLAAYMSCSYGVGQVMGSHWKKLGYASVDALIDEARSGLIGQIKLMVKFIITFGLADELRNLDWSGFARGYNGKNYRVNEYDTKMAEAYHRYGGAGSIDPVTRSGFLRLGSQGAGVRDLQGLLNAAGYKVAVDGDFGNATKQAVIELQKANKLKADGIVGPKTQEALTSVRATATPTVGQKPITSIKEVQQGIGTAIALPTVLASAKDELQEVVQQLTPYAYMAKVTELVQTGIVVLTVGSVLVGIAYGVYGWIKSKRSFTGTKSEDNVSIIPPDNTQLILPLK